MSQKSATENISVEPAPSPNGVDGGEPLLVLREPFTGAASDGDRSPSLNGFNGAKTLAAPSGSGAEHEDEDKAPARHGRDGRGRFATGNRGGAGNPFGRRVAALRQAVFEAISPENVRDVVASMIVRALGGDLAAAKLVLAYAIGKPAAPDLDEIDARE